MESVYLPQDTDHWPLFVDWPGLAAARLEQQDAMEYFQGQVDGHWQREAKCDCEDLG